MKYLCFLLIFFSTGFSGMCQSIITDRPTQGVSAEAVSKGSFQIETGMGMELFRDDNSGLTQRSFLLPTSLFRVGVLNQLEFRVANTMRNNKFENTFFGSDGNWQIDDLQVGFKWKLTGGESGRPQVALMSHASLPSGSDANTTFGVINKILVANSFGNVGFGYNIGYDYFGEGSGNLTYAINLTFPLANKIGVYIESYGAYNNFDTFLTNADAGFTYLLSDFVQLDYSFGIGINNRMNYQALGISILFDKNK